MTQKFPKEFALRPPGGITLESELEILGSFLRGIIDTQIIDTL